MSPLRDTPRRGEVRMIPNGLGLNRSECVFFLAGVPDTVISGIAALMLPMMVWGVAALPLGLPIGIPLVVWKTWVWHQIAEAVE